MKKPKLSQHLKSNGFTLVELLVVMAIIAILVAISIPVFSSASGVSFTKAVYDFQGALQIARSYAVSHHTYTWVGYYEEDASKVDQVPAVSGIGRVTICIVASKDGTSVYNKTSAYTSSGATPATQVMDPTRLIVINRLIHLEGIHVFIPPASGDSFGSRPGSRVGDEDRIGLAATSKPLLFQFQYPLSGTAQYVFGTRGGTGPSGIVQFNPQGEAISETGPVPGVAPVKEIAFEPTRGTTIPTTLNIAAINISGLTGQPSLYRK